MARITSNDTYGPYKWEGGGGTFIVQGTLDSATVTLQYSLDEGTTKDTLRSTTVADAIPFNINNNVDLYVFVSGGGGLMDFYLSVHPSEGAINNDITISGGATETTAASILAEIQALSPGTSAEPIVGLDDGPNEIATVTNLKAVSLGSAQTLAAAPGASLKAQIRDLFVSVDTDCYVSIFSTSGTMFVGNLKASNGTIQLCPRQGFTTAGTNEAISMISTSASGTHNTTVNSVSV